MQKQETKHSTSTKSSITDLRNALLKKAKWLAKMIDSGDFSAETIID
jgi:hypothetical protein